MNVTILTALDGKFKKAYLPKQDSALAIQINSMKELSVEYQLTEIPLYQRAKKEKKAKVEKKAKA